MSLPGEREAHHYPPTTAEWVTSPLGEQDELERNPLEPAPEVKPGVRLSALLVLISGLLALAALIVQLSQANIFALVSWSVFNGFGLTTIGFPMLTIIFPMAFAVGGVVRGITLRAGVTRRSVVQVIQFASTGLFLQLLTIPLAFIQLVASGGRSGQTIGDYLGPANWLAWASFLIMLATAWYIRSVVKPPATQEDVTDVARFQHLVDLNRNGGDSRRKITEFRGR